MAIKYHFLKKLSGKSYHPDTVKDILTSLGFEIAKEGIDELRVYVPFSKPDISLPADIVEEILRIDGLDNIDIPSSITITPSVEERYLQDIYKKKRRPTWLAQDLARSSPTPLPTLPISQRPSRSIW